jgi:hypothetical protein
MAFAEAASKNGDQGTYLTGGKIVNATVHTGATMGPNLEQRLLTSNPPMTKFLIPPSWSTQCGSFVIMASI